MLMRFLSAFIKAKRESETVETSRSYAEKVNIFSQEYLKGCLYISQFKPSSAMFTKYFYSAMTSSSHLLEDFLDSQGAKSNKNWYLYRELSAAVRHLSSAGYFQKHILNRLEFYDLPEEKKFREEGEKTISFLNSSLARISRVVLDEARRLSIPQPENLYKPDDFPDIATGDMLPSDIHDGLKREEKKNIVKIATDFLDINAYFEEFGLFEPFDMKKIRKLVPEKVNEVEIRTYEMRVHNLQSYFDTYVVQGGSTARNAKFRQFRGLFSVVLHLLQVMGRLLHFYERHLHDAGYKDIYQKVKTQLAFMVKTDTLLDRTINYALYYVCYFLNKGKELAHELLNESIERKCVKVGIPRERGFHCRPSLLVAKIVNRYGGEVTLKVGPDSFDASSVLELQYAGGKIQQEKIEEVIFEGDDRALKDIELLASVNYGEDTMGKGIPLPKELQYLLSK
jgi:phosphotransferase system HPr-like phosphotransfer protein